MCLSIPAKVVSVDGEYAEVDFRGVRKSVGITFVKDVKVGDYLLVHSGFAIEKMKEDRFSNLIDSTWELIKHEREG